MKELYNSHFSSMATVPGKCGGCHVSELSTKKKKWYIHELPYTLMAACVIKLIMGKIPLNKDSEFVVGEDKVLDYILAALFFALFLYGLIDVILHHFTKINYQSFVFMIALVPAFIFFVKGKNKRVYIRINKKGIYQDEKLVTGWPNLLNAFIDQKEILLSIQDNFILVVEYRKDGFQQGFRRKIPLTNTQNKSEEEVLEAIKFFWKKYRNDAGMQIR